MKKSIHFRFIVGFFHKGEILRKLERMKFTNFVLENKSEIWTS